ncbi:aminopeptidase P family protein [Desulfurococcaceae archaeon MEX13E-LK6-19]|nr:aminopeptidase P family protein [Desulfurococcaceae archaeon MEX13E-LK6-19]
MKHNLHKLTRILEEKNLEAIVLVEPSNIQYYTGLKMIADPVMVFYINRDGEKKLYTPVLEYYRARNNLPPEIEVYALSKKLVIEDMKQEKASPDEIVVKFVSQHKKIGIDAKTLPQLRKIVDYQSKNIVDISDDVWKHRMQKEDWELEIIKRAIDITIKGIKTAVDHLHEGITDAELAGVFEHRVRLEGVEEYAFQPLVLFKPDNSYPHNLPTGKRIGKRDLVLIDVGVKINGYCSDLTRTIPWKRPTAEERKALEAVEEAISEVVDKAEPGMKGSEIDSIARRVLEKHGLAKYFIHGLGHGLGIDVHERPYLTQGYDKPIEENMVFTIEPGVYIAGKYGVRIEEDAVMTSKGIKVLSRKLERILWP